MNKEIVKAGIIGFGYMGHFHLKRSLEVEGIEVIATYDISEEKMQEAKSEGLLIFDTVDELLCLKELSLIIICTPNNFHKFYAIKALEAGKNVLCEKPATMNAEEAKEIVACADRNGKFFTVHQNRRWDKDYLVVKEVYASQEIGEFTTINSWTYGQRGVCYGWRADSISGGGMLFDWGVHLIDQILQLYAGHRIKKVYGRLVSVLTPVVDDYFEVKLIFDNDVCANISVGTFALQPTPRWFVFGDRGTLKLDDFSGTEGGVARIKGSVKGFESVKGHKSLGPSRTMAHLEPENLETLVLPVIEDKTYEFYKNLVLAVRGEAEPCVKHEEVIRLMEVVDLIFKSSERGEMLTVDL